MPFYVRRVGKKSVCRRTWLYIDDGDYKLISRKVPTKGVIDERIAKFNIEYRFLKRFFLEGISRGKFIVELSLPYHPAIVINETNANMLRAQADTLFTASYAATYSDQIRFYGLVTVPSGFLRALKVKSYRREFGFQEQRKLETFATKFIADVKESFKGEVKYPLISIQSDFLDREDRLAIIFDGPANFEPKKVRAAFNRSFKDSGLVKTGRPKTGRKEIAQAYLNSYFKKMMQEQDDASDETVRETPPTN